MAEPQRSGFGADTTLTWRGDQALRPEVLATLCGPGAPFERWQEDVLGAPTEVFRHRARNLREVLAGAAKRTPDLPGQHDQASWPAIRQRFAVIFATRARDDWAAVFAGTDACVTPVLSLAEAPADPHLAARRSLVALGGVVQAGVAPRFSRSVPAEPGDPPEPGADIEAVLRDWQIGGREV